MRRLRPQVWFEEVGIIRVMRGRLLQNANFLPRNPLVKKVVRVQHISVYAKKA